VKDCEIESGQTRVVRRGRIFGEFLSICCFLEDYLTSVGTWAARTTWRTSQGNARVIFCLGTLALCAKTLALLLVTGGVEKNPGPLVEGKKILQVLCSMCDRNLKSGTQCKTCGRWFHTSCDNVKAQVAESGKWTCNQCISEKLRLLEEKLHNALLQIDELTRKNKTLEEQLRLETAARKVGRRDTVPGDRKSGEGLVLGDSMIQNVGTECSDMKVECFPSTRTEQLHRVIKNRDLGSPDTVVIHVGTNGLRQTGNLDYVMEDVYDLVNAARTKFSTSRVVLSGVLQGRGESWRRIGSENSRY
jgi:hypothetical protein